MAHLTDRTRRSPLEGVLDDVDQLDAAIAILRGRRQSEVRKAAGDGLVIARLGALGEVFARRRQELLVRAVLSGDTSTLAKVSRAERADLGEAVTRVLVERIRHSSTSPRPAK